MTRRNVSSKADTPTKPATSDVTEDEQSRDTPSKAGTSEPEHNNVPQEASPQGVLIPPSSFADSKTTKDQTRDLPLQDGALGVNKGPSSPKPTNLLESPNTNDQQISQGNDVSKDIKQEGSSQKPKSSSSRKNQKTKRMAPNFHNK